MKHLEEIFQYISTWPAYEKVHSYHIGMETDSVRHPA
jgi:hypothetical protein